MDLNKSTSRLRRKFDATDTWMETKGLVESVLNLSHQLHRARLEMLRPEPALRSLCCDMSDTILVWAALAIRAVPFRT